MKSIRHKNRQSRFAAANTPAAIARRIEKMRAKKMAAPAPNYDGYLPGEEWFTVMVSGRGWSYTVVAEVPPERSRRRLRASVQKRWPARSGKW